MNPKRRKDEPAFYGYIPDSASARTMVFGCMIINGTLLLLVRSASTALLAMVGAKYVAAYYAGDMAVYFAYKGARRDLTHWPPFEGLAWVLESFFERLIVKVIVSFTGLIQLRAPGEMGASYWLFDMALALAASPVATRIYFESIRADEEAVMEEGDAWKMVGGLSFGWVIFFVAFMLLIRRKYLSTFFSTQTGYEYVQSKFLREGDENKKAVFKYVRAKRAQKIML